MDLAIINTKTGEILEERVLFIGKNPKYLDRGYIKVFTAFLSDMVEDDEVAGKSIRLLFYMLENLDYNSYTITVIPKRAIEKLNISEKTYHNWIKTLIKKGIIEKVDRYTYRLKPYTFIRGSHTKALEKEVGL